CPSTTTTVGAVKVKVFDRNGGLLGEVTNSKTGTEYLGFATDDDKEKIAGVQMSLLSPENGGYLIGDISFIQQVPQKVLCQNTAPNNLVVNGSFEKPDTQTEYSYGVKGFLVKTPIEGWQSSQNIEINHKDLGKSAYSGSQFVDLDSINATTKISQKIATQVGKTYKLTFAFEASDNLAAVEHDKLNVYWGNELLEALDKLDNDTAWEVMNYDVEAKTTETILSFDNLNEKANSYGTRLDAVSLNLCQ
ncbi:MAG: DUF642 domain-containing protein, partial [Okeania sp. SIO3B5]|uniref:DUF642 domain-containing protein n=1 Tax=Okeania sp. SIO3B5 TaxID=2607811 RepID=UPI001401A5BF